jgi:hypothetical protein
LVGLGTFYFGPTPCRHDVLAEMPGRLERPTDLVRRSRLATSIHRRSRSQGIAMIHLKPPQWTVFNSDARASVPWSQEGDSGRPISRKLNFAERPGEQAKRIVWKPLKEMTRPYWASQPNETDLRIELITVGTICLRGADNYDSLRGDGLDFLVLDEYASIAKEAWLEVLRPALADRQGKALFIGTPRGYNHFYELYCACPLG